MLPAPLRYDLLLRAAGVVLLMGACASLMGLFHDPAAAHGAGGGREVAEAAFGFLGCSIGTALTLIGAHIHDPIAVSNRWATTGRGTTN